MQWVGDILTALSSAGINDYEKSIHIRIWMNQSGLGEWELQSIVNTKEISALFCSLYLSSFLLQIQSRRKHKLFFASSKYFYPGGVPEQLQVPADPHHQVSAARGLRHLSLHLQKLHRPGGGGGWALINCWGCWGIWCTLLLNCWVCGWVCWVPEKKYMFMIT